VVMCVGQLVHAMRLDSAQWSRAWGSWHTCGWQSARCQTWCALKAWLTIVRLTIILKAQKMSKSPKVHSCLSCPGLRASPISMHRCWSHVLTLADLKLRGARAIPNMSACSLYIRRPILCVRAIHCMPWLTSKPDQHALLLVTCPHTCSLQTTRSMCNPSGQTSWSLTCRASSKKALVTRRHACSLLTTRSTCNPSGQTSWSL